MSRRRKKRIKPSATGTRLSQTTRKPPVGNKKKKDAPRPERTASAAVTFLKNIPSQLCHVAKRFVLFICAFLPLLVSRFLYGAGVVFYRFAYALSRLASSACSAAKRLVYVVKTRVLILAEDFNTLKRMGFVRFVTWPRDTVRVVLKRTRRSRRAIWHSLRTFKLPTRAQTACFFAELFNRSRRELADEYNKIVTRESRMDDKLYRAKKRLISAGASALVCLVVLCLGVYTFGWFSNVETVSADGLSVKMPDADISVVFRTYAYDLDARQGTDHLVHSSDVLNIADYDFNTHDVVFTSLNKYTTTILELEIYGDAITYGEAGTVKITMQRQQKGDKNVSALQAYTSNILAIRCVNTVAEARTLQTGDLDTLWTNAKAYFEDNENDWQSVGFTTKLGANSYCINDTSTFTVSYTGTDVNMMTDSILVYIYLDYDTTLVSDFEESRGFTEADTVSGLIHLENDLYEIRVTSVKDE